MLVLFCSNSFSFLQFLSQEFTCSTFIESVNLVYCIGIYEATSLERYKKGPLGPHEVSDGTYYDQQQSFHLPSWGICFWNLCIVWNSSQGRWYLDFFICCMRFGMKLNKNLFQKNTVFLLMSSKCCPWLIFLFCILTVTINLQFNWWSGKPDMWHYDFELVQSS